ncbi:FecR family protein [Armatimonas sp.]|uniref:FecR family protein n=1 Tax=Armatimonas sp. TaxID=1872638 RepID=UPI00286CD1AE|nr:FecR family protein [Armatimonas sp.]
MTRSVIVSMFALTALSASAWAQGTTVGTLAIVRQVEVTRTRATPQIRERVEREPATHGESVFSEQLIRTLKRSFAEVSFKDGSLVRLKDRTEAIVRQEKPGTGVYLVSGTIWVRAGSAPVQVDTPTGVVTATQAVFEVTVTDNQTTVLCYDGNVQLKRDTRTVTIKASEFAGLKVTGAQVALDAAASIPGNQLPSDHNGPRIAWWQILNTERGLQTLPGSSAGLAIRSSALTEAIQATLNLPPAPGEIVKNPADKARLLSIAQSSVVPAIERTLASDGTLTLNGYRQKFGGDDISQAFSLPGTDLNFLRNKGIGNVGSLFDALNASGASFGVDLRSRRTTANRSVYRPSAWQGPSNSKFPLFDGAQSSNNLVLLGAVAAAALGKGAKATDFNVDGDAFGFTADPQAIGARGRLHGTLGKSRYMFEGNSMNLLTGSNTGGFSALSVASIEHDVSPNLTVFSGRRRFYSGPALLSFNRSQLLGERYSAVGATLNKSGVKAEAAWLYDSNPDVRGAQSGFLASATKQVGGGTMGVQALRVGSLNNGTGYSVSGSLPSGKGSTQLDLYGEVGVAPDKAGIVTLGAYFPWIYQTSDLDLYVEYSSHQDLGNSFTVVANRELSQGLSLKAFLGTGKRTFIEKNGTFGGLGLSYALGR